MRVRERFINNLAAIVLGALSLQSALPVFSACPLSAPPVHPPARADQVETEGLPARFGLRKILNACFHWVSSVCTAWTFPSSLRSS